MAEREQPVLDHAKAYSRFRRIRTAYRAVKLCAAHSLCALERTQSRHLGPTYGIEPELVKRIKQKFRNELSFSEGK
jgi:hypothetical protein